MFDLIKEAEKWVSRKNEIFENENKVTEYAERVIADYRKELRNIVSNFENCSNLILLPLLVYNSK